MPKKFWRGLFVIVIIYSCYQLFFREASYKSEIPRIIRHFIKFIVLISVYLIGVWHLSLEKITWMKTLWHLIHLSGFFFLMSLGAYYWIIQPLPLFLRLYMDDVNEFLIGPTLFVVMGILQQYLLKNKE